MKFSDAITLDAQTDLLGERMVEHRQELRLTQAQAASRAGLSRDAVQRAERGRGTVETLLRLLTAYGLTDGLDLLLPEPETGPAKLLAAQRRAARRQRVRRPAPTATPPSPWGDEA